MTAKKVIHIALWVAFVFYVIAVIGIMFGGGRANRFQGESFWDYLRRSVNPIPLKTILDYIFSEHRALAIRNIGGNLLLFLPMGFFLPVLFPFLRKLWRTVLCIGAMVILAESLQLILRRGIFDIDDLILNLTGALFGYFIYWIFLKISCKIKVFHGIL